MMESYDLGRFVIALLIIKRQIFIDNVILCDSRNNDDKFKHFM